MKMDKYQKLALTTALPLATGDRADSPVDGLVYLALGLSGEAGEFTEKVKKLWRDQPRAATEYERNLLKQELGDVLWYVAVAAWQMGFSLGEVADANATKLTARNKADKLYGEGDER